MAEVQRKRLAVIDGKSVFYRGYYAMPNLSTKDGTPTGGVFGFATMALEVIRRLKPDYVAVAWDKPKTNIRKRLEIYPEYKAGRKPAPPDFYEQIPVLHELLDAFGWPLYELDPATTYVRAAMSAPQPSPSSASKAPSSRRCLIATRKRAALA